MKKVGQIYKIHSDFYWVTCDGVTYECKVREVLKKQDVKAFVGDLVEFNITSPNTGIIEGILPRKSFLTRPSVANVSQAVIISAIKEPELDFEQLNRYISFAQYHGIKTKLCFNKSDLSENDEILEKVFSIYEPLGFDIMFTSALENIGTEEFKEALEDELTVFCGSSGVGKSSLINAIFPDMRLKTKSVSEKTQRGTHTTRHCEICEEGKIKIIDTPGFSNLKFDFLLPHEVATLFEEIREFSKDCKFNNCLHLHEKDCNVLKNLDKIDETRYKSYVSFVKEAQDFKEKLQKEGLKKETFQKENLNKKIAKISAQKRQQSRNNLKQEIYKELDNE